MKCHWFPALKRKPTGLADVLSAENNFGFPTRSQSGAERTHSKPWRKFCWALSGQTVWRINHSKKGPHRKVRAFAFSIFYFLFLICLGFLVESGVESHLARSKINLLHKGARFGSAMLAVHADVFPFH